MYITIQHQVLSRSVIQEEETKELEIKKNNPKLSLFKGDKDSLILYMKDSEDHRVYLLHMINTVSN